MAERTTNSRILLDYLKIADKRFKRSDLMSAADMSRLSPYMTYAVNAGILAKVSHGIYEKTDLMEKPVEELEGLMRVASDQVKTDSVVTRRGGNKNAGGPIEVDYLDILDQLKFEQLFDVLAAKINVLAAVPQTSQRENANLKDQLAVKDGQIKSLQLQVLRLEEKQKTLNAENERLTALMSNSKPERLVLAKPVNAVGSAVFKDGERKTLSVYRRVNGQ